MKRNLMISFLVLFGVFACIKQEEFENLEPANYVGEWGAPLINSSITFDELLKNYEKNSSIPVKIITDKDNVYHIVYTDSSESPKMDTYYKIQDVVYNGNLGIPADKKGLLPDGIPFPISTTVAYDTLLKQEMSVPLDFEDKAIKTAQIKYIDLNDGQLTLDINSDFKHDVKLILTINALTKDGSALKIPVDLKYGGTSPIIMPQIARSLAGYRLDLTNGGTTIDTVTFKVDVEFKTIAGNTIQVGEDIKINLQIKRLKYFSIVGKLGQFKVPISKGNMEFNVFNKDKEGVQAKLKIQDPKIDLKFTNQLGVAFGVEFKELLLKNPDGQTKDIELADGKEIQIQHVKGIENLGDSVVTDFALTNESTNNFFNAFEIAPNEFKYDFLAVVGDDNNPDFFLHENAKIKVGFTVDIPVAGAVESYIFEESMNDIGLADIDTNYIESAELRFIVNNGWPFTVGLQAYFVDDSGKVLDSLFTDGAQNIIQSGTLDDKGIVTAPFVQKTIIQLDRPRYKKIATATKVNYRFDFKTGTDGKEITKILSTYRLGMTASAKVKMNAKLD